MAPLTQAERLSFDRFEVDLRAEELWRGSRKVRCQRQPFRVLCALAERQGELVSREELQHAIWGSDLPADADHSLGIAINKLRDALGDSAENPRFVETLARRGYRFIAPVSITLYRELVDEPAPVAGPLPRATTPIAPETPEASTAGPVADTPIGSGLLLEPSPVQPKVAQIRTRSPLRPFARQWQIGLALLLFGLLAGFLFARFQGPSVAPPYRIDQVTHNDSIFPGVLEMESYPVIESDGTRLYSSVLDNGQTEIASIDPLTGEMQPLTLPSEIVNPLLTDISPDGSRLLVRSQPSSDSEQPIWVVPREGGSALRVGNIRAHDAVWMPDGQSVLFAVGDNLDTIRLADGTVTQFATLPGRAFRMQWSPDGKLLRFTLMDPLAHTSSLWQIARGGKPRQLLAGWTSPPSECCGVWSADGRNFVFASSHDGASDLWKLSGRGDAGPGKLTNGPLQFTAPASGRGNDLVYFVGLDSRSELQRYDAASHRFTVEQGFLAGARRVSYSVDRDWVAWTDGSGHLWRARAADGSQKVELTGGDLQVFLARWSPDSQHLMAMARKPGQAWRLYLVSADGGVVEPVLHEKRNEADPTWAPDGVHVAFGRTSDLMGREPGPKQIEVLDLSTHTVASLPGSDGLFSPRWSPDGRWIAALTLGEQRLMLYDVAARTWHPVAGNLRGADPVWATLPEPDGRGATDALYIHQAFSNPQTIDRISVPDGGVTRVATLTGPLVSDKADYVFVGITRADAPLVRVRTATGNIYSLTLRR
jgi:Tol biopolymer transport system component/DNA-binding winged helix-turn-helix (wHTH) protein